MKEELEKSIDRNIAGLDDMMLKQMLLAYYQGLYLDDTTIWIEVTKEELGAPQCTCNHVCTDSCSTFKFWNGYCEHWCESCKNWDKIFSQNAAGQYKLNPNYNDLAKKISKNVTNFPSPFSVKEGFKEKGYGEDKKFYFVASGNVEIYVEDSGEKLVYYKEDILDEIYKIHYLDNLYSNNENRIKYAESVKEYLKKCYTYNDNGTSIKMYSQRTVETTQKTIEYMSETKQANDDGWLAEGWKDFWGIDKYISRARNLEPVIINPIEAQTINFYDMVSQYATPVAFLADMLEISASKEFVNAFIETVGDKSYIKLNLYEIENQEVEHTEETKTRETEVLGERNYTAKVTHIKGKDDKEFKATNSGPYVKVETDGKNVKVSINDSEAEWDVAYRVELFVNGTTTNQTVELGKAHEEFLWIFKWDSSKLSYWWGFSIPAEHTFSHTSDIKEITDITKLETKYDIGITEIKTWYGTITPKNSINAQVLIDALNKDRVRTQIGTMEVDKLDENLDTSKQLYELLKNYQAFFASGNGTVITANKTWCWDKVNKRTTLDGSTYKESVYDPHTNQYKKTEKIYDYDKIFAFKSIQKGNTIDMEYSSTKQYKEEDCLNVQYNWAIQKNNKYGSGFYALNTMLAYDTNIQSKTIYSTLKEELVNGNLDIVQLDLSHFLGLLRNNIDKDGNGYGEYELRAEFYPATSGGKIVEYQDLYGSKSKVGELLVNGSDMLYDLLDSQQLGGVGNILREALKMYKDNNYIVYHFNYLVFSEDGFEVIK